MSAASTSTASDRAVNSVRGNGSTCFLAPLITADRGHATSGSILGLIGGCEATSTSIIGAVVDRLRLEVRASAEDHIFRGVGNGRSVHNRMGIIAEETNERSKVGGANIKVCQTANDCRGDCRSGSVAPSAPSDSSSISSIKSITVGG